MNLTTKYQCSLCKRTASKITPASTFNIVNRCIATANCSGTMFAIAEQTSGGVDLTNNTWSPRKALHTHTQIYPSNRWAITHNLGVDPAVVVYVNEGDALTEVTDFTISNQVVGRGFELILNRMASGSCQCIARESFREQPVAVTESLIDIQISSSAVLTLGLTHPEQFFVFKINTFNPNTQEVEMRFMRGETYNQAQTAFFLSQRANSAWSDVNYVNINRRNYKIALVNVFNDLQDVLDFSGIDFVGVHYTNTNILSYTDNQLNNLSYSDIAKNECEVLLANAPFSTIDKITNQMIDVADLNRNNLSIVNNNLFVKPAAITNIPLGILF